MLRDGDVLLSQNLLNDNFRIHALLPISPHPLSWEENLKKKKKLSKTKTNKQNKKGKEMRSEKQRLFREKESPKDKV